MGMLLISHDLSVLAHACDRVAVMYAGRVVETGPAADVFADARHPYAKALAAAFPVIGDLASRRAPRGLPGDPPDPRELPSGCPFHVALPGGGAGGLRGRGCAAAAGRAGAGRRLRPCP